MRLPIASFAVVSLLACSAPRTSPEYERAAAAWNELLRADPDAAAEDPRADEVLEQLSRVPAKSSDAPAALALRTRIEEERRERAAERSRRAEALRRAATPPAPVTAPVTATSPRPVSVDPAPPRGPAVFVGMKAAEFHGSFGACFDAAGDVTLATVGGQPRAAKMWSLKDDERCRAAHPGLVAQVVVLSEDLVAAIRPASEVRRYEIRQEGQFATLPDGRPGMFVDGKLVPLPPGARVVRTDGGATP